MATGGSSSMGLNIQHGQKKITLYMSRTSTIKDVIVKSAKELKIDNQHLILLHQGSRLSDNVSLEVHTSVFVCVCIYDSISFHLACITQSTSNCAVFTSCFCVAKAIFISRIHKQSTRYGKNIMKQMIISLLIGDYNGYCRSCGMVSSLRPILICSQCRKVSH